MNVLERLLWLWCAGQVQGTPGIGDREVSGHPHASLRKKGKGGLEEKKGKLD